MVPTEVGAYNAPLTTVPLGIGLDVIIEETEVHTVEVQDDEGLLVEEGVAEVDEFEETPKLDQLEEDAELNELEGRIELDGLEESSDVEALDEDNVEVAHVDEDQLDGDTEVELELKLMMVEIEVVAAAGSVAVVDDVTSPKQEQIDDTCDAYRGQNGAKPIGATV